MVIDDVVVGIDSDAVNGDGDVVIDGAVVVGWDDVCYRLCVSCSGLAS